MTEVRYLRIYIVSSRIFKCSYLHYAKCGFYREANANFGKVGHVASEETILQLIKSKCLQILLYCLEGCQLNKIDLNSLDFVINRFFMKLFKTTDINNNNNNDRLTAFDPGQPG